MAKKIKLKDKKEKVGKQVMQEFKKSLKAFKKEKVDALIGILDEDNCTGEELLAAHSELLLTNNN